MAGPGRRGGWLTRITMTPARAPGGPGDPGPYHHWHHDSGQVIIRARQSWLGAADPGPGGRRAGPGLRAAPGGPGRGSSGQCHDSD